MPPQGSTVSMSAFLPLRILFSSTDVHKEKTKTCHISGKFPNICIICFEESPNEFEQFFKNSNTTASHCQNEASKYPQFPVLKFCFFNHAKNTRHFLLI